MNREIKFRAWDKETNTMISEGYHVIGETTIFGMIDQYLSEHPARAKSSLERFGDIVEMQFSGLKDKNRKDIYEGDIVEVDYVQVRGQDGIFRKLQGVVSYEAPSFFIEGDGFDEENQYWDEMEVIGNIFENPELIETK